MALLWLLLALAGLVGIMVSSLVIFTDWLAVPSVFVVDDQPIRTARWLPPTFMLSLVALAAGLIGLAVAQFRDWRRRQL